MATNATTSHCETEPHPQPAQRPTGYPADVLRVLLCPDYFLQSLAMPLGTIDNMVGIQFDHSRTAFSYVANPRLGC